MLGIKVKKEVQWFEYVFLVSLIFLSYLVYVFNVSLVTILVLNGTICCFTYVIVFPIWIHLKCVLYDRTSGFIEGDEEGNKCIKMNQC